MADTKLTWNGDVIIKNVNSGTIKALTRSINIVQTDAKNTVRKRTTNLEQSIVKAVDTSNLTATASTNSKYAFAQEFGRPDLKQYSFTPYMRPALNNNKDKILKIFEDEEKKAIND